MTTAPARLTIAPEHIRATLQLGPGGVLVQQTNRLDDWLGSGHESQFATELTSGFLTVAVTSSELAAVNQRVALTGARYAHLAVVMDSRLNPPAYACQAGDLVLAKNVDSILYGGMAARPYGSSYTVDLTL